MGDEVGEVCRALEAWEGFGILFQEKRELIGGFISRGLYSTVQVFSRSFWIPWGTWVRGKEKGSRRTNGRLRKRVDGVMMEDSGRTAHRLRETDAGAILEVGVTCPGGATGQALVIVTSMELLPPSIPQYSVSLPKRVNKSPRVAQLVGGIKPRQPGPGIQALNH